MESHWKARNRSGSRFEYSNPEPIRNNAQEAGEQGKRMWYVKSFHQTSNNNWKREGWLIRMRSGARARAQERANEWKDSLFSSLSGSG